MRLGTCLAVAVEQAVAETVLVYEKVLFNLTPRGVGGGGNVPRERILSTHAARPYVQAPGPSLRGSRGVLRVSWCGVSQGAGVINRATEGRVLHSDHHHHLHQPTIKTLRQSHISTDAFQTLDPRRY